MKIHRQGHTARIAALLFISGLAAPLSATAAKGYHLWYDDNGQAVYSQLPPEDGRSSEIVKGPPPPAESPEQAQQRLHDQIQRLEDSREDKALAEEKTAATEADASQARQRCETARRNLEALDGRPRQLYRKPDGSVVRMDEDERQQQRAEMEKIIAADCK